MSEEEILKYIKEMIQFSDHNMYKMALQRNFKFIL